MPSIFYDVQNALEDALDQFESIEEARQNSGRGLGDLPPDVVETIHKAYIAVGSALKQVWEATPRLEPAPAPGFLYSGPMHSLVREALAKVVRVEANNAVLAVGLPSEIGRSLRELYDRGDCGFELIDIGEPRVGMLVLANPEYLEEVREWSGESLASEWIVVGPLTFDVESDSPAA